MASALVGHALLSITLLLALAPHAECAQCGIAGFDFSNLTLPMCARPQRPPGRRAPAVWTDAKHAQDDAIHGLLRRDRRNQWI